MQLKRQRRKHIEREDSVKNKKGEKPTEPYYLTRYQKFANSTNGILDAEEVEKMVMDNFRREMNDRHKQSMMGQYKANRKTFLDNFVLFFQWLENLILGEKA